MMDTNPYAVSSTHEGNRSRPNPFLLPAILLLIAAAIWEGYVLLGLMMVLPGGGLANAFDEDLRPIVFWTYVFMLLVNGFTLAGAVALLARRQVWLAWTGCIISMIPCFGTWGGLTIPLAIWLIVLMRKNPFNPVAAVE